MSEVIQATLKSDRSRGARRAEILQALASMLQEPDFEKVTTARLAASLGLSEAALYRHFRRHGSGSDQYFGSVFGRTAG